MINNLGLTQERSKYACPVCNSPLERDSYVEASETLKRFFHEEFLKDEEEFEKKLKKATEIYHKQVEELRIAHAKSQMDLRKELFSAHQKEIVELTKYHDAIISDSHRQFHEAVRQNVTEKGEGISATTGIPKSQAAAGSARVASLLGRNFKTIRTRLTGLIQHRSSTEV